MSGRIDSSEPSLGASKGLPRVLIDARMVERIPHGVARYVTHIASGLQALKRVYPLAYEPVFLLGRPGSGTEELDASEGSGDGTFHGFRALRPAARYLSPRELLEIPRLLARERAALYHSPSFSSLLTWGPWRAPCPWVVTVHDLNHLSYGDWRRRLYYRSLLRPFTREAAVLATVSEFSRREISAWSGVARERIEVAYNAIDPGNAVRPPDEKARPVLEKFGLEAGRYFLCISNPKPHKNVGTLVEAFARLKIRDWPLVLSMTEFGDRPGVRAIGPLSDPDASVIRAFAGVICFPSEYEGFGLPPVEAAVAGVPLIVSRIAPHEEGLVDLAPGEASWVAPRDLSAWRDALDRARQGRLAAVSPQSRDRILARFSEEALARHMDRIYRRVLNGMG